MSIIYINPYQVAAAAYDPDAQSYITAVEAADGQALEVGVKDAINAFVVGCKADSIWAAIKAACIMAGARTLAGALVPLVGSAPTKFNFVSGDYDRGTGLVNNTRTKYLDSNRSNNADPQNNQHLALYASTATNGTSMGAGVTDTGTSGIGQRSPAGFTDTAVLRSQNGGTPPGTDIDKTDAPWTSGFAGVSRSSSATYTGRSAGTNKTFTVTSQTPLNANIFVYGRNSTGALNDPAGSRLAFYSIGESLDLALLDTRVTALVNAIDAAIP